MKIKDPEILNTLREFCKVEARRMREEERAEIARRAAAKGSAKKVRKTRAHGVEHKQTRKAAK